MLNLSVAGMLEKSRLSSDGVWLLLVEVAIPDSEEPLRLVRNNEDIVWKAILGTPLTLPSTKSKKTAKRK